MWLRRTGYRRVGCWHDIEERVQYWELDHYKWNYAQGWNYFQTPWAELSNFCSGCSFPFARCKAVNYVSKVS